MPSFMNKIKAFFAKKKKKPENKMRKVYANVAARAQAPSGSKTLNRIHKNVQNALAKKKAGAALNNTNLKNWSDKELVRYLRKHPMPKSFFAGENLYTRGNNGKWYAGNYAIQRKNILNNISAAHGRA